MELQRRIRLQFDEVLFVWGQLVPWEPSTWKDFAWQRLCVEAHKRIVLSGFAALRPYKAYGFFADRRRTRRGGKSSAW